jgi:hypothetical protein
MVAAVIAVVRQWLGHDVVDRDGYKAGTIVNLHLDEGTQQVDWALVRTGLLGSRLTLVPLHEATVSFTAAVSGGGGVQVRYDKTAILDAPSVALDEDIFQIDIAAVVRHYGLEAADGESNGRLGGQVVDQPGAVTGTAEGSGSSPYFNERRNLRRVRLSRFVVTDYVAEAIPGPREEGRREGKPIAIGKEQMRVDDGQVQPPSDLRTPAQPPGGLRGSRRGPIGILGRFVRKATGAVRRRDGS